MLMKNRKLKWFEKRAKGHKRTRKNRLNRHQVMLLACYDLICFFLLSFHFESNIFFRWVSNYSHIYNETVSNGLIKRNLHKQQKYPNESTNLHHQPQITANLKGKLSKRSSTKNLEREREKVVCRTVHRSLHGMKHKSLFLSFFQFNLYTKIRHRVLQFTVYRV